VAAEFLESERLRQAGFRHAFFTRRGGASSGPYRTLNFSRAVGDSAANVAGNLTLAAVALGLGPGRIFFASQVHGAVAHELTGHERTEQVLELEADALASLEPSLACSVRTADCVPILIGERRTGASVAIHAGWRGVVRGIVEAGVSKLRELAGSEGELVAALGPHIRAGAFEVSDDVALELQNASPVPCVVRAPGAKPHVDLAAIVTAKLERLGLARADIDDVGGCTVTDEERFFSFRRDGKVGGRHLSAIVPRGKAT
jgi:YfiH family protein